MENPLGLDLVSFLSDPREMPFSVFRENQFEIASISQLTRLFYPYTCYLPLVDFSPGSMWWDIGRINAGPSLPVVSWEELGGVFLLCMRTHISDAVVVPGSLRCIQLSQAFSNLGHLINSSRNTYVVQ